MHLSKMWKVWQRRAGAFAERQPQRRRSPRRPSLFLEPLEDRTLLSAWTPIGPAPIDSGQTAGSNPVSGRITGLATDPGNANIVYAATAGGGIWKSINANTANPTWTPLTDNLTDSNNNPLPEFMGAVAETDATSGQYSGNQIVYGGMGEVNYAGDTYYGEGILVSTNGGANWTLTTGPSDAFNRLTVAKIAIDPTDPTGGTAYAAVCNNGDNGLTTDSTGIWKTTNFGQTWTNMTGAAGLSTSHEWTDVVVDPHTGNVYAAQGGTLDDFAGAAGNGVYESIDGGTQWSLLSGVPSGKQDGRITLALYDNGTTNELFVAITNPTTDNLYKMLKSVDGGAFTDLTANLPTTPADYLDGTGDYSTTLAIDPQNPSYIYAGGTMYDQGPTFNASPVESFDGGNTWQDIATDPAGNGPHTDDHAVAFDANGNLIDGDDGGVFKLTEPTSSTNQRWSSLNTNLQITEFDGIAVNPTNTSVVYGASQDNGTEKTTGSLGWSLIYDGDGGVVRVDPANPSIVYTEHYQIGLAVSTNGGGSFNSITTGIKGGSYNFYTPYALDSSGNVYYGTDYLNFSNDQGSTWTQIGTPGTNNFNKNDSKINSVAVSPTTDNVVYVATGGNWNTTGGQMFVTQNAQAGGSSVKWTEIDLPANVTVGYIDASIADSIAVDPADTSGGTAYAVVSAFTGGGKHVWVTTNFGSTWTDITGTLPDIPVDSVVVSPDGNTVYVGTDVGVYSTSNVNGSSTVWTPLGTGLPNAQVADMELVPSENLLVIGTHGRGAWEISTLTPPVVTTNPSNQTVTAGQNATFTAAASGNPAPTVQWQVSTNSGSTWTNISGATSTTLTVSNVTAAMNGDEYQAVFTNSAGSVATSAAALTVQFAPTVTTNPSNQTVTAGQTATFTAAANGNPAPTVQWQVSTDGGKTFTAISGATSTTLTLTNVTAAMNANQYEAVFTNSVGSATTSTAVLTMNAPPSPPAPPSPLPPPAPPTLSVPPLLSLLDSFLAGTETVNADGSDTITYSLFGIPLIVAQYDSSGDFLSASLFGINLPNWIWSV